MRSNLPEAICSRSLSAIAESGEAVLALPAPDTVLVTSPAFAVLAVASMGLSAVKSLAAGGDAAVVVGAGTAAERARPWAETPLEVAVSAKAAASAVPA